MNILSNEGGICVKRFQKALMLLAAISMFMGLLSGCSFPGSGGKGAAELEQAAVSYATNIANSEWDDVIKASSGDQLAVYMQLVPVLEAMKQTTEVRRVEVVDTSIGSNKNLAFVTVHVVKTVSIPDYGSVLDDKQVLLSMKQLDGQWKVFKMDVVNDIKTALGE